MRSVSEDRNIGLRVPHCQVCAPHPCDRGRPRNIGPLRWRCADLRLPYCRPVTFQQRRTSGSWHCPPGSLPPSASAKPDQTRLGIDGAARAVVPIDRFITPYRRWPSCLCDGCWRSSISAHLSGQSGRTTWQKAKPGLPVQAGTAREGWRERVATTKAPPLLTSPSGPLAAFVPRPPPHGWFRRASPAHERCRGPSDRGFRTQGKGVTARSSLTLT